LEIVADV
jgi:hypothetical protein